MEMLHFSSLEKRIGRSLVRFPVAYGLLFLLVLVLLAKTVAPSSFPDEYFSFLWVFSAVGFLIALAMDLLREKKVFGARGWLVEVVALALWLVIWLTATRKGVGATYTAVSVAVAAVVAGLTVPFLKDRDDERICLGARDILQNGFSSGIVTMGVLILLFVLIYHGDTIFKNAADMDSLILATYSLFGPGLFGVMLLSLIQEPWPSGKGFSKISDGAARWLFLPLLCVYLVTLYVYAFRILLQWKLPDGYVAVLVTISMGMLLALVYVLGPWGRKDQPALLRVLPWLVIPLLGLMTVGIVRRVSDYGWTVERIYLALFNLWCYGVCLYLGLNGCRKFRWVPISFAAILLLVSIGPWNISRMVQKQMVEDIRTLLGDTKLPLTPEGMHGLESEKADAVLDKLDYLNQHYDKTVVSEFVEQPFLRYKFKVDYSYADVNLWRTNNDNIDVEIPDRFSRCGYFNDHPVEVISVSERTFRMSLKQGDGVYEFDFPILGVNHPVTLTALEGRAIFYLRYINVDGKVLDDVAHNGSNARFKSGFVSGMLFY